MGALSTEQPSACEILAELRLDERAPQRTGKRLIEWAQICGVSGVVMPSRVRATGGLHEALQVEAKRRHLKWFVELSPGQGRRGELREADGYLLRQPDEHSEALLSQLRTCQARTLVLVEGESADGIGWRTILDPAQVTAIYMNRGDDPGWRGQMKRPRGRFGCAIGYTDTRPDPFTALNSVLAGAQIVMKGLTLNRSLGGSAHQDCLYPHELAWLVEITNGHGSFVDKALKGWPDVTPGNAADEVGLRYTESLVARRPLRAGALLSAEDVQRVPELNGLTAAMAERLIGTQLLYDREPNDPLTFGVIEPLSGRTEREPLDVSVVIRTKNEGMWLRRALSALRHQQRPPKEIIVVDNDSTDDTKAVASAFGCTILTIRNHEFSFGRALNWGVKAARTPWVAILSAHCIPLHERWLEAFVRECGQRFVAAVYGKQEPLPDTSDFDKRDLWTTFGQGRRVQQGRDYFFHNANSIISKAVWERLPFDESLNGVEDRDWAKKVLADGYQIIYTPLASVHHYHGIHQGRSEARARRVVKVIELIHQREPTPAQRWASRTS